MATMRDIKRRKESITSTGQITKAMKLVATVKLQKAKSRAENSKPYFNQMYKTMASILSKSGGVMHPFLEGNDSDKKGVIVVTSNRGLAGGYNSNLLKLITRDERFSPDNTVVYPVGKKGVISLGKSGYEIKTDYSEAINNPLFSDAVDIGREVLEAYENGEIGEIYIAYTTFKNTVTQIPTMLKLLPMSGEEGSQEESADEEEVSDIDKLTLMNYEPEAEEALEMIVPKYINSIIFGALVESVASENGARMQAMDSATSNAEEMIDHLTLLYNRARQSAITQELTEIIAGSAAVE
jgi:F-type H+-transporting ATPase subunit gamma